MRFTTAPYHPPLRVALGAICALWASSLGQTVLWSEMGGGFGSAPQHVGIVGQESSAGEASRLDAGFLAHPLFLNLAPLAKDTSVQVEAESLSVALPGADVDGQVVSGLLVLAALHGTSSVSGVVLTYRPTSGYLGADSLGYQVLDDQGAASDTAWVRIRVVATTALAPRHAKALVVGTPDVRINRLMASGSTNQARGGLTFSTSRNDDQGLSLSLLVTGPSSVQVQIYDNLGTFVTSTSTELDASSLRALANTGDGRRELVVRWDLRDSSGRPVPEGVYLWRILILTQDGQKLETVRKTGVSK